MLYGYELLILHNKVLVIYDPFFATIATNAPHGPLWGLKQKVQGKVWMR